MTRARKPARERLSVRTHFTVMWATRSGFKFTNEPRIVEVDRATAKRWRADYTLVVETVTD